MKQTEWQHPHSAGIDAGLEHRTITIGVEVDHSVQHAGLAHYYTVTSPAGALIRNCATSHEVATLLAGFMQAKQAKVSRGQTVAQREQGKPRLRLIGETGPREKEQD